MSFDSAPTVQADDFLSGLTESEVDPAFVPTSEADLLTCLGSWRWRIYSGQLYQIMIKGEEGTDDTVLPFVPNAAQIELLENLHNRNVVLKARQLGLTTLMAIILLDHALFQRNQRCGLIAHDLASAEAIFADKVKFAYDNLPEFLRSKMPVDTSNAQQLSFAHSGSSIRVSTSMRSGTINRLHISEMGKIAKESSKKAREIVTGSLPAVPLDGILTIESTAEGTEGEFYNIASRAQAQWEEGRAPAKHEYKFFFFPWFMEPAYRIDPSGVKITEADEVYFAEVESYWARTKQFSSPVRLDAAQRAFYVAKREHDFSGDAEKMWQEFPSTPDECWQRSTEGTFYARQLSAARKEGRITVVPHIARLPVFTWWDIGARDGVAIWLSQYVGHQHRMIGFIEGWDEGYDYYVRKLRETGYVFGAHFLPHDAAARRQMQFKVGAPVDMLRELAPDWTFHIVPRVESISHGIAMTRMIFPQLWFDKDACAAGLEHLALYRKRWNNTLGVWSDEPDHDNPHTEAADALRQLAQGFDVSLLGGGLKRPTRKSHRHLGARVL
jgi:hypothetical protein